MRLKRLSVRNYRTLEDLDLEFPNYYTAISGRNDSGKTNVVRAIRCLMRDADPYGYMEPEFSLSDDYTKWVDSGDDREMSIEVELTVFADADAGLHQFISDYLSLDSAPEELLVEILVRHRSAEPSQAVSAKVLGNVIDDSKAEQLLRKIQSERTILFHSSTDPVPS